MKRLREKVPESGLEKTQLIVLGAIRANDLPSDDCCVICHERYGTTNEDGTVPEYAVRLPCGHAIGNVCIQNWVNQKVSDPDCIFCNKTIIPARYLQEQVREIWIMLNEMSPEHIHDELSHKTTHGPLIRSIEPLWRYVDDAPSLKAYSLNNARLVPSFEWLLVATAEFLAAVKKYAELSVKANSNKMNFEALWRKKHEFESTYESFQSVVLELDARYTGGRVRVTRQSHRTWLKSCHEAIVCGCQDAYLAPSGTK